MNLEDGIDFLKEKLTFTIGVYRLGLEHAIWVLEEKLDKEERERLYYDELHRGR